MNAQMRKRAAATFAVALAALGLSRSAAAFESSEHCALSNFAVALALDQAIAKARDPDKQHELTEYRATFAEHGLQCFPKHWFRPGEMKFSYGKISALVDAQNTLDDVFLRYGSVTSGAESDEDLSETYFGDHAWLLGRFSLAGHNNISHFQGLLMASFARWHENAVVAARGDGNLFQALAAHAIADHFLQDFFAPGHVVTARDNLPDVVALGWHDRYNHAGLPIMVQNWSSLAELAGFAVSRAEQPGSNLNLLFSSILTHDGQVNAAQANGAIERALKHLQSAADDSCPSYNEKDNYRASRALLDAVNLRRPLGAADNEIGLCIYGDGAFSSSRAEVAKNAPAQALLMTLIQARYLLDVIDEYQGKRTDRTFPAYLFCPQMTTLSFERPDQTKDSAAPPSPEASEPRPRIGCEDQLRLAEQTLTADQGPQHKSCFDGDKGCTPIFAAPIAITQYAAYVIEPAKSVRFFQFDPVFALTTGFKSGSSNAANAIWALETLPLGLPGARDHVRDRHFNDSGMPNLGLAFGYEGPISNSGALDHAYTARLIWAVPRLDMQFSAYGKRMYLEDALRDHKGWGYGLRFETGFSLLTAYLSFGREPVLENGSADRDEVFGAGVTFSIGSRRALGALGSVGSLFD